MRRLPRVLLLAILCTVCGLQSVLLRAGPRAKGPLSKSQAKKAPGRIAGGTVLGFRAFLRAAARHDPAFQEILVRELYLKYGKQLGLPPSDLLLEVTGQYGYYLDAEAEGDRVVERRGAVSLTKLFPTTGTRLSIAYRRESGLGQLGRRSPSSLGFEIGQAIAGNAFGRITRKTERHIELQTELARHQLVEAYEDYVASLMVIYLNWYRAQERRRTAETGLKEARRLHGLTRLKARYGIAYRLETHKSKLDLITAQRNLVLARNEEQVVRRRVASIIGRKSGSLTQSRLPDLPGIARSEKGVQAAGRTRRILKLLTKSGILLHEIARAKLLPSADLFAGYEILGPRYDLVRPDRRVYFGATLRLNFGRQVEKAQAKVAALDRKRTHLQNRSRSIQLEYNLSTVRARLRAARRLRTLAREQVRLARLVLAGEQYNYRLGRSDFNDLSRARLQVETARITEVEQDTATAQLHVELLRLEDRIVRRLPKRRKP